MGNEKQSNARVQCIAMFVTVETSCVILPPASSNLTTYKNKVLAYTDVFIGFVGVLYKICDSFLNITI